MAQPVEYTVGQAVRKLFPRAGWHDGIVTRIDRTGDKSEQCIGYSPGAVQYFIKYTDGDSERMVANEVRKIAAPCKSSPSSPKTPAYSASVFDALGGGEDEEGPVDARGRSKRQRTRRVLPPDFVDSTDKTLSFAMSTNCAQVWGPHNMDYPRTRWPQSPRIAMQCVSMSVSWL